MSSPVPVQVDLLLSRRDLSAVPGTGRRRDHREKLRRLGMVSICLRLLVATCNQLYGLVAAIGFGFVETKPLKRCLPDLSQRPPRLCGERLRSPIGSPTHLQVEICVLESWQSRSGSNLRTR